MYFLKPIGQIFTFTIADENNLIALSDKGSRDGVKMSFEALNQVYAPKFKEFNVKTSSGLEIIVKTIQFCTDLYECWNLCNSDKNRKKNGLMIYQWLIEENIKPRVIIEGFRRSIDGAM